MSQKPVRIDQILPSYAPHDAVGNHVTLTRQLLEKRGFASEIFAEMWSSSTKFSARPYKDFSRVASRENICIYQFSVGSPLARFLYNKPTFKICSYHNITPHHYFAGWDLPAYVACLNGRHQFSVLRNFVAMTWSVSDFNRQELIENGFHGPHLGFPVLRDYERLSRLSRDEQLGKQLRNRRNTLFVGRLTPHKGQIDLISLHSILKKHFVKDLRLILVGSGRSDYRAALVQQAIDLGLVVQEGLTDFAHADVLFVDNVNDELLAEIYRSADLFLSLSEHEGFCVPIVESMSFGVPIIAHAAAAIPETLGTGGETVDKFDFPDLVRRVAGFYGSETQQGQLREKSEERAKNFSWDKLERSFDQCLERTLERYHGWYLGKPVEFRF
jgi:glycosyltransferase involved in cell wall biosynthesis